MLTDAHCHPQDLIGRFPAAEAERRRLGVSCAASSTRREEFEQNEDLAQKARAEGAPPMVLCFAVHPQLPGYTKAEAAKFPKDTGDLHEPGAPAELLEVLDSLAAAGRLDAVGETGFDLYDSAFRETEPVQDDLFAAHLETALGYDLPLVLHVRRAMHKIFAHKKELKKCRSLIFHSWPGTLGEGESLLKSGINVYFSFGTTIILNHREAMRCCAAFPLERLLSETDAPWQPPRGKAFSAWGDLPRILGAAAALRREAGKPGSDAEALEANIAENYKRAFGRG